MSRREAYLEALGLTPWVLRERGPRGPADPVRQETPPPLREASVTPKERARAAAAEAATATESGRAGIALGPGQGSCLFLCGAKDDVSSPLASDLARVLPEAPVWAHVADDDGQSLEAAIAERLFTHVVVFGAGHAQLVFGGDAPERCGPAHITVAPDLKRLAGDARSRRRCWSLLRASGVVSPR